MFSAAGLGVSRQRLGEACLTGRVLVMDPARRASVMPIQDTHWFAERLNLQNLATDRASAAYSAWNKSHINRAVCHRADL